MYPGNCEQQNKMCQKAIDFKEVYIKWVNCGENVYLLREFVGCQTQRSSTRHKRSNRSKILEAETFVSATHTKRHVVGLQLLDGGGLAVGQDCGHKQTDNATSARVARVAAERRRSYGLVDTHRSS